MPTDLLLAAFALTLLINAVLVAVSLQSMRRARGDGRAAESAAKPPAAHDTTAGSRVTARPDGASPLPDEIARAVRARRSILGEQPSAAPALPADRADPPSAAQPPADRAGADRAGADRAGEDRGGPDRPRSAAAAPNPAPAAAPGSTPKRRRRKFSLPPLDDDHDKVSRSIESFLAGGDATGPAADAPGAPAPPTAAAGTTPTTVALVAVCGPTGPPRVVRPPDGEEPGPATPAIDAATSIVERTLRGAARGTDTVDIDAAGRFRIVLSATGELAARAYLRRIRATVEPLLQASVEPLRLVTATATVLAEPLAVAHDAAERRLAAALARSDDRTTAPPDTVAAPVAGAAEGEDEDEPEPRAAGD